MSTQDAMGAAHDQARLSRLRYVHGDYADPETFSRLKNALGDARRPIHYLAIPPWLFEIVTRNLGQSGATKDARVVLEKAFGHDLASAREMNGVVHSVFPEKSIFRIDHFLGKEAIENISYFRFWPWSRPSAAAMRASATRRRRCSAPCDR